MHEREREGEVEEAVRDFVIFWPLISLGFFVAKRQIIKHFVFHVF